MDYDDFLQLIKSRRSIRSFTNEPVKREQIETLIEAASWAPSNHNRQGWKFIVFDNQQTLRKMAEMVRACVEKTAGQAHRLTAVHKDELVHFAGAFDQAPLVILVMHKQSPSVAHLILSSAISEHASGEVISAAMACQNLLLAAHTMGLGACIMTAPLLAGRVWKSMDNLPAGFEPTCLIALGYPAQIPQPPKRKKLEFIIEYRG